MHFIVGKTITKENSIKYEIQMVAAKHIVTYSFLDSSHCLPCCNYKWHSSPSIKNQDYYVTGNFDFKKLLLLREYLISFFFSVNQHNLDLVHKIKIVNLVNQIKNFLQNTFTYNMCLFNVTPREILLELRRNSNQLISSIFSPFFRGPSRRCYTLIRLARHLLLCLKNDWHVLELKFRQI